MDSGGIPGATVRTHAPMHVPVAVHVDISESVSDAAAFPRLRPDGWVASDAARGRELLGASPLELVRGRAIGSREAKHGVQRLYTVLDARAADPAQAILKALGQGGAQEVFAHDVAVAMGIDDLFPKMAWREAERAAAIELFDGRTAADFRISGGSALDGAFEAMVRARHPMLTDAEVARRAEVDRQLVHVFDAIIANGDRHPQNVMVQRGTDELRMIDHGLINRYKATEGGLVPTLRAAYSKGDLLPDGTRGLRLLPEVQQHLATIDQGAIRSAFERMMDRIGGSVAIGREAPPMTNQFLDDVLRRLESFAATGLVRVRLM